MENITVVVDETCTRRYSSEIYFTVKGSNREKLKGVIFCQDNPSLNKGDILFIHKKIKKITSGNLYNNMLISRGIHYICSLNETDLTVLYKKPLAFHASLQRRLLEKTDIIFRKTTSGLIKALFTGNKSYIDKKIIIQYRDSGLLHVLSASGLHVAIFASFPAFILVPFLSNIMVMGVSLISVFSYLFITDMPVSLLRAAIMFAVFYIQLLLCRQRNIFNCMMITCTVILLISPWEIFSPGFQLSFAATAGIIVFYKQFMRALDGLPRIISNATAVTLAAQLTTLPVILVEMNQINTAGLVSNLLIVPVITLIMAVSALALGVSFFSITPAVLTGKIADIIFSLSLKVTDFISSLRLNFFIYDISFLLCLILLIGLIPLINHKQIRKLKFYPVLLSLILCTIYLKKTLVNKMEFSVESGKSKAEVLTENGRHVLKLNLTDEADSQDFIIAIKSRNPDIRIIELDNVNYTSLLVSKILMNDYIIDEFRFNSIPEPYLIRKILSQFDKDNIRVKFSTIKLNFQEKT